MDQPCLACGRPRGPLCDRCRPRTRAPAPVAVGDGVVVQGAWEHRGPGRRLVHRLKYQGVVAVAALAAVALGGPPADADVVVPVPRVLARRVVHGVDPSRALAEELGARWGLPVADVLRVPAWAPRRAGRRLRPPPPPIRATARAPSAVVVDDVVTTGETVRAAAAAVGARRAVAVTVAPRLEIHADPRGASYDGMRP